MDGAKIATPEKFSQAQSYGQNQGFEADWNLPAKYNVINLTPWFSWL